MRGQRVDIVVVGAGLAGLTAGVIAGRAGADVLVLEAAERPGGRARTVERDRWRTNLGPHALYRAGPGRRVLRELGVEVGGAEPPSPRRLMVEDRLARLPEGPASLVQTGAVGWKGKLELLRFFAGLARADAGELHRVRVGDWLAERFRRPAARRVVRALIRLSTYVDDPSLDAGAALGQLQVAAGGVDYLHGGWQRLVDALGAAGAEAGVRRRTGVPVRSVEPAGSGFRVKGVGVDVAASSVILALPPAEAAEVAGPSTPELRRHAEAARPARVTCLDLVLADLPEPARPFVLGMDRPVYLSVHSVADGLVDDGEVLVSLLHYRCNGTPAPPAAEATLESLMDRVQPGWREKTVARGRLPDMVVQSGIPTAAAGGLPGRPGVEVSGSPGLFVAGEWVGAEGLLADAALASGARAGRAAVARLGMGGDDRGGGSAVGASARGNEGSRGSP